MILTHISSNHRATTALMLLLLFICSSCLCFLFSFFLLFVHISISQRATLFFCRFVNVVPFLLLLFLFFSTCASIFTLLLHITHFFLLALLRARFYDVQETNHALRMIRMMIAIFETESIF